MPGSMVFSAENYNLLPNIAVSNAIELYQGDQLPEEHYKQWIKKKKGIRCDKAGAYLSEYNLRFFIDEDNDFGECFLDAMAYNYQHVL